jgi:hypothetical protein
MTNPIDISSFQFDVPVDEDAAVERPLLDALVEEARAFVESRTWAPPISELLLAFGIGGVIGLFLVRFEHGITSGEGQGDDEIWVVVGDMPSIYFETEDVETRADALSVYCNIAEDWADHVLAGDSLAECYPIPVEPTREHAMMLKSRLATIRRDFIPLVE